MRRRMVSLWDLAEDREVGVGFVECADVQGVVCRHKWVLDQGFRFSPTGLVYRPAGGALPVDEAEAALSRRWQPDSRLIVCEARLQEMPTQTSLERRGGTKRGKGFSNKERIELKGVWPIEIPNPKELQQPFETIGFVFVPYVKAYSESDASADPTLTSTGLLHEKEVRLRLQNRYVEHWALESRAFPLLDLEIVVRQPQGQAPLEESFFEQMAPRMRPGGSYTEVLCATWVQHAA